MSESATKTSDSASLVDRYRLSKELYATGNKTHGGGVVCFDENLECFRFVSATTGSTILYAGLEKSLKQYFWPDKPPPTVHSYKRSKYADGKSRYMAACASFSSTGLSSLPAKPLSGKKLGSFVHQEIDTMFKVHGTVNSKLAGDTNHHITRAVIKKLEEERLTVIDTEVVCWDPRCAIATKADLVCTKNGRFYVVELKTGSKKNFNLYNAEIRLESGNVVSGRPTKDAITITDSSRNRACVQAATTCIQFCMTHDISIESCTPVVIHAPDKVEMIYISREFVLTKAVWIYVETAEARKRALCK